MVAGGTGVAVVGTDVSVGGTDAAAVGTGTGVGGAEVAIGRIGATEGWTSEAGAQPETRNTPSASIRNTVLFIFMLSSGSYLDLSEIVSTATGRPTADRDSSQLVAPMHHSHYPPGYATSSRSESRSPMCTESETPTIPWSCQENQIGIRRSVAASRRWIVLCGWCFSLLCYRATAIVQGRSVSG